MFYVLKELAVAGLGEHVDVRIKEVPVSYVRTQQIISDIWETLHPKVKNIICHNWRICVNGSVLLVKYIGFFLMHSSILL